MRLRRRHRERGAAAVEFALVLPVLVLFVFGIVDLGRAFMDQAILTNAAREGTRYATVVVKDATTATNSKTAIESRAKAAAGLDPTAQSTVTANFTYNCAAGTTMVVTVTYPQFNWLFLNVLPGLNNPQPLIGKSVIGCP